MKRTVAFLLVVAMLACMIPVFSATAADTDDVQYGLNADFYQLSGIGNISAPYRNIIGTSSGEGNHASFEDTQRFEQSIEALLAISTEATTTANIDVFPISLPAFDSKAELDWEGFMIHWTGTITSATGGTYYFVGEKVDNGFVAFVDQDGEEGAEKKVYEYWASHHWFDRDEDVLYSDTSFTLEAGVATEVEMWFMEANGGQVIDLAVTETAGSGSTSLSAAGITFDVDGTLYRTNLQSGNHDPIRNVLPTGVKADGTEASDDNGAQANAEGNHHFEESFESIKALMTKVGSAVVSNYESASFEKGYHFGMSEDDFMIEYNGYVTPTTGGTYEFGTRKVDNCLYVEIEIDGVWTPVYEFWAKNIWNDNGETYYGKTVDLEEGETYPIHAVFLEVNGGQAIESRIKINDTVNTLAQSGLVFTTTAPEAPVGPTTVSYFATGSEWYYMTSGLDDEIFADEGWATNADIYTTWETANADLGKNGSDVWATNDQGLGNAYIWAVKEFTVEDVDAVKGWALMTEMYFDDNIHIYINGTEVFVNGGWNNGYTTYKFVKDASAVLVEGKNVIAVELMQGHGGYGIDLSLYATCEDTSSYAPTFTLPIELDSADELLAFVEEVNANPEATKNQVANITGNIDMTGKTWVPMTAYYGTLKGNGYTISGITYNPTVDASANTNSDGVAVGMLVNNLGNNANIKGHIYDLTLENCTMNVNATDGDDTAQYVIAGLFAGSVDRGYISNCTVSGCTIKGATVSGGIAGVACWAYDTAGVYVQDCTVENTTVEAGKVAGGVIGYARGGDAVILNDTTFANVTLTAPQTGYAYGGLWYTELRNNPLETVTMNKPAFRTDITLDADKDYALYYQTRTNASDSALSDIRVIIIADTAWLRDNYQNGFVISFTDGTTTKTLSAIPTTFYKNVTTDAGDTVDMYGAVGDTVIVGWVVTEVPAGFTPSVTVGNTTYGA